MDPKSLKVVIGGQEQELGPPAPGASIEVSRPLGMVMEYRLPEELWNELRALGATSKLALPDKRAEELAAARRLKAIDEFWQKIGRESGFDYTTVRLSPGRENVPGWFIARELVEGGGPGGGEEKEEECEKGRRGCGTQ